MRPLENFLEPFENAPKVEKMLQNPHPSHFQPDLARRVKQTIQYYHTRRIIHATLNAPKELENSSFCSNSKKGAFKRALHPIVFLTSETERATHFTYVANLVCIHSS